MPLIPMPPIPTKCTRRVRPRNFMTTARCDDPVDDSGRRVRPRERPRRRWPSPRAVRGRPASAATDAASDSPVKLPLLEQHRRAGVDQHLRVLALVVVGRAPETAPAPTASRWRPVRPASSRRRGRSTSVARLISSATRSRNGSARASTPARSYPARTSPTSRVPVWWTIPRPASVRASCGAAATMATLIACAPWEPPRTSTRDQRRRSNFAVRTAKNSARTGLPATNPLLPKYRSVGVIRHGRGPHAFREQPVRQARHGVLLQHHGRNSAQRRQEHDRSRAVAADANHHVRPASREQPPGVEQGQRDERRAAHAGSQRLALQPGTPNDVELEPFGRDHAGFEPPAGSRERDPRIRDAALDFARHGNPWKEMPARAATGDHHRQPGHVRDLSIPRIR